MMLHETINFFIFENEHEGQKNDRDLQQKGFSETINM